MIGVLAAVTGSICWTYACFLWRQQSKYFSAIQINSIKNSIAALLFLPFLFSINWIYDLQGVAILFLSGVLGIALGDTLYIAALYRLGTRNTLTIEALSPIFAYILGTFFLKESLFFKTPSGR